MQYQAFTSIASKNAQKFPFGDTLLKDLGILQPQKAASYPVSTVVRLAKRFPQLGLADSASLSEEFDFTLSPSDLPTPGEYHAADEPKTGFYWSEVGKIKTLDGKSRFLKLFHVMAGLLTIPVSNADSERGFSILRNTH